MIPECSFPIPDPDFFPSGIPDPGLKKSPDPKSAILLISNRKSLQNITNKLEKPSNITVRLLIILTYLKGGKDHLSHVSLLFGPDNYNQKDH
jgi:hypothetical protein